MRRGYPITAIGLELIYHSVRSFRGSVFQRKEYLDVLELAELAWSPLAGT